MPKQIATEFDELLLEHLLEQRKLSHIRVRRRGDVLTLESGPAKTPHARFRRQTTTLWTLEMPYRSTWERTPYRAPLTELFKLTIDTFGWMLQPLD